MTVRDRVAARFDREAANFDAIYTGEKSAVGRAWDRLTRENIHWRFGFTLEAIAPIEGKKILDVGCGSGRYCVEYARRGAVKVVGIDVSQAMLDIASRVARDRGLDSTCRFLLSDVLEYHPDEKYDIATAIGFFDYIPDPVGVLSHLREITSGTLVASFPPLWTFRTPFRKLWRMMGRCYLRFYTRGQVEEYCGKSGWKVERLVTRGPVHMLVAVPHNRTI
jgi:2-polyprenyl-3-methyl-5-hydroxy-6-metoxy-1,4-benzoquinol methylase